MGVIKKMKEILLTEKRDGFPCILSKTIKVSNSLKHGYLGSVCKISARNIKLMIAGACQIFQYFRQMT